MRYLSLLVVLCLFSNVFAFAPNQDNDQYSVKSVLDNSERVYWEPSFSKDNVDLSTNPEQAIIEFAKTAINSCRIQGIEYKVVSKLNSGKAEHYRLVQTINGTELYGSDIVVSTKNNKVIEYNGTAYTNGDVSRNKEKLISKDDAIKYAMIHIDLEKMRQAFQPKVKKVYVIESSDIINAYIVKIASAMPLGDFEMIIDAVSGDVLKCSNKLEFLTGEGNLYKTNPMLDDPAMLPLKNLSGNGTLKGKYVKVINEDVDEAYESNNIFNYEPSNTHFDEVNVYYHVNFIHNYYKTVQNFSDLDSAMSVTVHKGTNYDNAYYSEWQGGLFFGDGNKLNDLSKEEAVIWHEYTHAVTGKIVSLDYSSESGAMNEAFSDFIPCSISNDPKIGEWAMAKLNKPYMRICTNTNVYPDNIQNEVHADSKIYSGSLWDLRKIVGPKVAERLAHLSRYYLFRNAKFSDGFAGTLKADEEEYNGKHSEIIKKVFANRGITETKSFLKAKWLETAKELENVDRLAK